MAVPGSCEDVWCHNILHFLLQSPQDAELGQDMVWTMNQVMFHLDIKAELEVALEIEFYQQLQIFPTITL